MRLLSGGSAQLQEALTLAGLEVAPGGVAINAVSPAFDGWLWCALLYMLNGLEMVIVDPLAQALSETVTALDPDVVCLTPTLLAACVSALNHPQLVVTAGEACPAALATYSAGRWRTLRLCWTRRGRPGTFRRARRLE